VKSPFGTMNLSPPDPSVNLLPRDGTVCYYGPILEKREGERYFGVLHDTLAWEHDEVVLFGRRIVTARQVAWYGDEEFAYTYSGTTRRARPWTPELGELRSLVEEQTGDPFNACLLNLYHDGTEGMSWHSDDERELAPGASIASLSLGAARKFSFKHRGDPSLKVSLVLEPGSLLVMRGETQKHWLHALPKAKRITEPRINLTFRRMADA